MADQPFPGEQKNTDVRYQHADHHRQDRRRGESQCADNGSGKREHDHQARHLRERLGSVQVLTPARHTAPQVAGIVHRRLPVQEHLSAGAHDAHAGWTQGGINLDAADSFPGLIA